MKQLSNPGAFIQNGLSRRSFMKLGATTGFAAAALGGTSLTPFSAGWAQTAGGTLRVGAANGSSNDTFDPATFLEPAISVIAALAYDFLIEINPKGEVVPSLAESWSVSDDGLTWTFVLRKDVTFHNGKPFDAHDVVATLNHHLGPKSKSAVKPVLSVIVGRSVSESGDLVLNVAEPYMDLPYLFSLYHLPIYPADGNGGIDWASMNGTGPYRIDRFDPGVTAIAKKTGKEHFGPAYFDTVEIRPILDTTARTNGLMSGELDLAQSPDVRTVDMIAANPDIEIDRVVTAKHYTAPMNCQMAPFDNPDVRRAFKYAIDREELVDKILNGYGIVGNDNPVGPTIKYHADLAPSPYDPDKAKFYLKKAGYDTIRVDLSTSDVSFPGANDAAQLIAERARPCGIEVTVVREAADGYWSTVWQKKPWMLTWWSARPTADLLLTVPYTGKDWNETNWHDEQNVRFTELLKLARAEKSEEARAELYAEAQQILKDDSGQIVLMFPQDILAHTKSVSHGELHSNNDLDGLYVGRRWWRA